MSSEPPVVIGSRKELTYLLCLAAELEHGVMCQYLYAAFSLKQDLGERVESWRSVLLRVAADEMLHWALVNNVLTAVGSAPYFSRPHLPHQAKGYPAGVQLALVPFGERALRHFLFLERPEGMAMDDAAGFERVGPALPIMSEHELAPRAQEFDTVGHLYRSIQQGLADLAATRGEDLLFIGPPGAQATSESFGWPELTPVTDLAGATEAIDRIVEQGEGARGDWTAAHYGRFLGVLDDYLRFREERPDVDLVHPVAGAGVRAVEGMEPDVWITDRATAAVSDLFDAVYDLLLQLLVRWFAFGSETDEQLTVLGDVAVTLMFGAIEPLGFLLATLPVGPEHPAATAGAHFQLAYRANFLLPHRRAAWIRFTERLEEIADFAASVQASPDCRVVLDRVEASCRALGARLGSHIEPL